MTDDLFQNKTVETSSLVEKSDDYDLEFLINIATPRDNHVVTTSRLKAVKKDLSDMLSLSPYIGAFTEPVFYVKSCYYKEDEPSTPDFIIVDTDDSNPYVIASLFSPTVKFAFKNDFVSYKDLLRFLIALYNMFPDTNEKVSIVSIFKVRKYLGNPEEYAYSVLDGPYYKYVLRGQFDRKVDYIDVLIIRNFIDVLYFVFPKGGLTLYNKVFDRVHAFMRDRFGWVHSEISTGSIVGREHIKLTLPLTKITRKKMLLNVKEVKKDDNCHFLFTTPLRGDETIYRVNMDDDENTLRRRYEYHLPEILSVAEKVFREYACADTLEIKSVTFIQDDRIHCSHDLYDSFIVGLKPTSENDTSKPYEVSLICCEPRKNRMNIIRKFNKMLVGQPVTEQKQKKIFLEIVEESKVTTRLNCYG